LSSPESALSPVLLGETQDNIVVVPETQITGAPNPPVRNIVTSQNHEESQLTDTSGYASGSPQSFGNNHKSGFSDDQGSMEEGEGEEAGGDNQDDLDADMDDPFNEHFTEAVYTAPSGLSRRCQGSLEG
jgi:hypothetical protein